MSLTIGELFAGYGGLGMGVASVLDAEMAWYSEVDKGALKVLAHRFPGIPNVGDITTVDWSTVPRVDILTGGSPCQDLSHAGRRKGMTEGTRSNLWVAMREAIAQLKPGLVVWENVEGAASAEADSEVEPCAGCVGDGPGVHLRALGRVVGDLSSLGYVGRVGSLRAADVGAPHGRRRRFLVAYPNSEGCGGIGWQHAPRRDADRRRGANRLRSASQPSTLLPSPRTSDTNGAGRHGDGGLDLRTAVTLLSTPAARAAKGCGPVGSASHQWLLEHGDVEAEVLALLPTPNDFHNSNTESPEEWLARRADVEQRTGTRHGPALPVVAWSIHDGHPLIQDGAGPRLADPGPDQWGPYAPAIHRWEALTRPAPSPTETGPKGNPRLSARFSEWLMGLPDGWITDVPGVTRNEALKLAGNGVVPQQAAAALRFLLSARRVA